MARWTQTITDQRQLAVISKQMPIGGIARIALFDGVIIEGVLRRVNIGNNAGRGGWQYYGECEVETKDRARWVIDYLDIKSANSIWSNTLAAEYEQAGLISLVGEPDA